MYNIKVFDHISQAGLQQFTEQTYQFVEQPEDADVVLVRSSQLQQYPFPKRTLAVGRAGAGVNNIPVDKLTQQGVVVLNTPGANANAVKELVIAGMLLAARHICQAWSFASQLQGDDESIRHAAEFGKKNYIGYELPNRTLAVIGLGAIGVPVANTALNLGMRVVGFDPAITLKRAWQLSSNVIQAHSLAEAVSQADFITCHVPLMNATKNLMNSEVIAQFPKRAVLLNFSREEVICHDAVLSALEAGHLSAYVCDFPAKDIKNHSKVIALPHLGASTLEATENCATMIAAQIKSYLEDGNIENAVNLPSVYMPRIAGFRVSIINANVVNMVGQISTLIAEEKLNILDMLNKSQGDVAYTLIDLDKEPTTNLLQRLRQIKGVLAVRSIS